jgi:hypothetical protein
MWPWLLLVLLPIAAAGWFYWETIESAWHKIASQDRDAAVISDESPATPGSKAEKAPTITADSLDKGLGIGLSVYTDYHTLLEKTKGSGIEWEFTASGNALRLSAPGVKVYVEDMNITAYTLTFDEIWAADNWNWWQKDLARAGLSEKTTPQDVAAEGLPAERISLYGKRSIHQNDGWATPAYEVAFFQGKLDTLRAGIRPGPGPTEPAGNR